MGVHFFQPQIRLSRKNLRNYSGREHMGNDLFVHVSRDGHTFIARRSPDTLVEEETNHPMTFDTQRCHLFDKDSGENLTLDPDLDVRKAESDESISRYKMKKWYLNHLDHVARLV
jgi:hypothetical protein